MDYDLLIRGAQVVSPDGLSAVEVAVSDGVIVAVERQLGGSAELELDAGGLHVLPGGIDCHVHCDEPGRTSWEGFATASAALAAGGMTGFVDMPLNASPPTVDTDAFDAKLAAASRSARIDFALWGAIVPGNLGQLEGLHARGVVGFKAFMSETGMDDFRAADDATLLKGMRRAAELDALVAVHAENDTLVSRARDDAVAAGRTDARAWLDSRPPVAELEAIGRAITFAADAGCRLHIVHVSTAEGIALVQAARAEGVDVSWETATHFLVLTEDDVCAKGPLAKCAPVMRDAANLARLWSAVGADPHAIVASDHSPCEPAMKETDDFFAAWGGISGCQSTLGVLLEGVRSERLCLSVAVGSITANVADRLRLGGKGRIAVGLHADLTLVDLDHHWLLSAEELQYRHRVSALIGHPHTGAVRHVFSRGRRVIADGELIGAGGGRLIRPLSAATTGAG